MINGVKEPSISHSHGVVVKKAFGKDTTDLVSGRQSAPDSHSKRVEQAYLFIVNYYNKDYPSKEDIDTAIPSAAKKYKLKEATLYRIFKTR